MKQEQLSILVDDFKAKNIISDERIKDINTFTDELERVLLNLYTSGERTAFVMLLNNEYIDHNTSCKISQCELCRRNQQIINWNNKMLDTTYNHDRPRNIITVGHLIEQLQGYDSNQELFFGGLDFYRLKDRGDDVQVEFNQSVYEDSDTKEVIIVNH